MKTEKISDRIHYIGVNDRTTHKFEGMWPLPLGVSYNSYLIEGSEKCAIIDSVEVSHSLQLIDHIRGLVGDRKPDYLIINHMEPDHSGAIRILRAAYPDIIIVGNTQTLSMVKGYYGEDTGTLTVADGDTLNLGPETTLQFALTPMVHWPETMMTYLREEKTLFSGDAFGCFGALNGAVIDNEMNTERYYPEMVRYYSNIVGKYGTFVQRALKKLEGMELGTVCPTHGPVWRSEIDRIKGLYDTLSRYEPLDNGVTIVYGSMYGHTELMAETAADALADAGIKDISVINASVTDLSYIIADIFRHRGLVIASPTYSNTLFPPITAVMEAITIRDIRNREIMTLGSHTWAQKAVSEMGHHLENAGLETITEPVVVKQSPDSEQLSQIRAAATALAERLAGFSS